MRTRQGLLDPIRLTGFCSVLVLSLLSGAALAQSTGSSAASSETQAQPAEQPAAGPESSSAADPQAQLQAAEQMAGLTVVNQQGEKLGKIDSIVRDKQTQQLGAVITSGGFLGMGGTKLIAPLDQLRVETPPPAQPAQGAPDQVTARGPKQPEPQAVLEVAATPDTVEQQLAAYDEQKYDEVQLGSASEAEQPPAQGSGGAAGSGSGAGSAPSSGSGSSY